MWPWENYLIKILEQEEIRVDSSPNYCFLGWKTDLKRKPKEPEVTQCISDMRAGLLTTLCTALGQL